MAQSEDMGHHHHLPGELSPFQAFLPCGFMARKRRKIKKEQTRKQTPKHGKQYQPIQPRETRQARNTHQEKERERKEQGLIG